MKKRVFLLPLAVSVTALISAGDPATAKVGGSELPIAQLPIPSQTTVIPQSKSEFVLRHSQPTDSVIAGHFSHSSHVSHSSHMSHVSHSSHYSGY